MNGIEWKRAEARARLLLDDLKNELVNRDWKASLKPWSEFFKRFTVPKREAVYNRVVVNSHIYQANYIFVFGMALLYYVLTHPMSLFIVGTITVACVNASSPTPIVIGGRRITQSERHWAVLGLSLVLLTASGVLRSFSLTLGLTAAAVLAHACFRHTNVRHKVSEFRHHVSDAW